MFSQRDQLLGLAVLGVVAIAAAFWALKCALKDSVDEMDSSFETLTERNQR